MATQTQGTMSSKNLGISAEFPWRLLSFSAIIFGFALFIYLGMVFGYEPYLNSQAGNLNQKISALNQSIDENQQKQIIGFYSQLVNIQDLLKTHKPISSIFDLIEKNTYQSVSYSNLRMSVADKEIRIDGSAPDYETLIKEVALWNKTPEINRVVLENIISQESPLIKNKVEVKFSARLILN
ncbi:hypothetical protein HZC33_02350 [Candidatus Wolfebacteria bacterium]|nr:hypothetical protein [Candidatus Wolfebacteria bacterium]